MEYSQRRTGGRRDMFDASLARVQRRNRNDSAGSLFGILAIFCKRTKNESTYGLSRGLAQRKTSRVQRNHFGIPQRFRKTWTFPEIDRVLDVTLPKPGRNSGTNRCLFVDRLVEILNSTSKGLKRIQRQAIISHMSEFKLRQKSPYRAQLIL